MTTRLPSTRAQSVARVFLALLLASAIGCDDPVTSLRTPLTLAAQWTPPASPTTVVPLADSVRVAVTHAGGRPREGARVVFVVTDGGGSLSSTSVRTGASGTAAARWTLGPNTGLQRVRAFSPDDPTGAFIEFSVTVVAGPASAFTFRIPTTAISPGDSSRSFATFRDAGGVAVAPTSAITYASADTTIATVSASGYVRGVRYGRTAITASAGTFSAVDTAIVRAPVPDFALATFTGVPTYRLGITPSGIAFLPGVAEASMARFNVNTGTLLGAVLTLPNATLDITTSADGNTIVAASYGNEVFVINPTTFTVARTIALPAQPVRMQLNAAGTILYFTYFTGGVGRVDLTTDAVTTVAAAGTVMNGIALSPDETLLFASSTDGNVHRFTTAPFALTHTVALGGVPQGLTVSRTGQWLFVAREAANLVAVSTASLGSQVTMVGGGFFDLIATQDGRYILASGSHTGRLAAYDATTFAELAAVTRPYSLRRFTRDAVSGDYWIGSEGGQLTRLRY